MASTAGRCRMVQSSAFSAARSSVGSPERRGGGILAGWDNLSRAVGVESLINWRQVK